jgi:poly(hydroxyalkanoate) depolymerase family esterase
MLFLAAIACGTFVQSAAQAASLSGPVTGWSSGVPSYISMYEYVPANVAASPPIVVAAHYCGGSASAFFGAASGIVAAADKYGFIMIFPQTTNPASSAKCWDVGSKASLTHDGGGDTQAIAQMVKYEVDKRHADAGRVYVMGASSGAMLAEAMLAVYPDIFKAGAEFSGVPAGCWSAGWSASSNWGGTCAGGQASKTAQQWGDLVRGMYPGYSGFRPRVQLWHGTADTTINYNNQTEAIKEWTNVLGLPMTPTSTDSTSVSGFKIEKWQNTCGFTLLEAHTQSNGGHTTPIDANAVISFFGLDKPGPDPQAACGGNGSAGGTGSAGMPSGGAMGAGRGGTMAAGRGGAMAAGSSGGMAAGGGRATAGMLATAGMISAAAGQVATGNASGAGLGGASANAGTGTGTPPNSSGSSASADNNGSGGCAVGAGADTSSTTSALILAMFMMTLGSSRRRRRSQRHSGTRSAER